MNLHQNDFRKEAVDYFNGLNQKSLIIERPLSSSISLAVFFFCFSIFLLIIMFFPHVKKVKVIGVISPDKGLSRVYSESFGSIRNIDVNLGDYVNKGDALISIKPEFIDSLNERDLLSRIKELDEKYDVLIKQVENEKNRYSKLKAIKLLEIEQHIESISFLKLSLETNKSKVDILEKRYEIITKNGTSGAISAVTLEQKMLEYLDAKEISVNLKEKLSSASITAKKLSKEYEQLSLDEESAVLKATALLHDIKLSMAELKKKNEYDLLSPVQGEIIGIESSVGVRVDPSVPIVTILPTDSTLSIKLYVPSSAIGFLKIGDNFKIEYAAFPAKDYGHFEGKITKKGKSIYKSSEISSYVALPQGDYFICEGALGGKVTGIGKQSIKLNPGMNLFATLEGDRKSIFMWLFRPIYESFKSI
jgi:membrane fusion protein